MRKLYEKLPINLDGRDFVVSDIHGCYEDLIRELDLVNFNKSTDRVIAVGDLCDRGPESLRCLQLMHEDWFYTVMGNHEWLWSKAHNSFHNLDLVESRGRYGNIGDFQIFIGNGGDIIDNVEISTKLIKEIESLPLAIEIDNGKGNIGVVHAELYVDDWNHVRTLDDKPKYIQEMHEEEMLWGRSMCMFNRIPDKDYTVYNISDVYMGHTIVPEPMKVDNRNYIETGVFLKYKKSKLVEDKITNPRITLVEVS